MGEDERPPQPQRPALSSDAALDRLLWRLGPLMRWEDHEETSEPGEGSVQPDPAFARRLRARLTAEEEEATPPRDRRGTGRRVALRVGLAAAALALVILVAVAVVEVGVVAALTTALALVAIAAVLIVRARLGQ
jgi:Flp pilus assembly protein TadB